MEINKKNKIIGILGGGQLAKMSLLAAAQLGFESAILDENPSSPAGKYSHCLFTGAVTDIELLDTFIDSVDIVTLENEFIDAKYLEYIEHKGMKVLPSSKTLSLIQDKFTQKLTFRNAGLPVPTFLELREDDTYASTAEILGEKFILKSRKMGYDGYGNALVTDEATFQEALAKLNSRNSILMAEKHISFESELAMIVVKSGDQVVHYPLVKTFQVNHICKMVQMPAGVAIELEELIREICTKAIIAIEGEGIFGFEFFLEPNGKILINEVAPRPHNSGHLTIEACVTSQFENHIRAVAGLPLGSAKPLKSHAVMVNILGKREGVGYPSNYEKVLSEPDLKLHIYGKEKARKGRKMGHITMTGETDDIFTKALNLEKEIEL